jgi:hypothetical protein
MENKKHQPLEAIGGVSWSQIRTTLQFDQPVIILSAPRAGSTLLFEILSQAPHAWTIAGESQQVIESIPAFHPRQHSFDSNRLTARDITDASAAQLLGGFWAHLRDRDGHTVAQIQQRPARMTFVEKTPKNALRIPFLNALFPAAKFIFLHRDPRSNIGSLIDGWNSRKFITYPPAGMAGAALVIPLSARLAQVQW